MSRLYTIPASLLLAVALVACAKADPYEAGQALGRRHADAVRAHTLTVEQMIGDLSEAGDTFDGSERDRARFSEGYREALRPVRSQVMAMLMEAAGSQVGEALGEAMEGVGEGLGRALSGFMRGVSGERGQSSDPVDAPELDKAKFKEMGRGLGKVIKGLAEGAEAMAEGLEEELDKVDPPPADAVPDAEP